MLEWSWRNIKGAGKGSKWYHSPTPGSKQTLHTSWGWFQISSQFVLSSFRVPFPFQHTSKMLSIVISMFHHNSLYAHSVLATTLHSVSLKLLKRSSSNFLKVSWRYFPSSFSTFFIYFIQVSWKNIRHANVQLSFWISPLLKTPEQLWENLQKTRKLGENFWIRINPQENRRTNLLVMICPLVSLFELSVLRTINQNWLSIRPRDAVRQMSTRLIIIQKTNTRNTFAREEQRKLKSILLVLAFENLVFAL